MSEISWSLVSGAYVVLWIVPISLGLLQHSGAIFCAATVLHLSLILCRFMLDCDGLLLHAVSVADLAELGRRDCC